MKEQFLFGIAVIAVTILTSCGNTQEKKICGVWQAQGVNEFLVINSDGTLQGLSIDGMWKTSNDEPLTLKLFDEDSTDIGIWTIAFVTDDEIVLSPISGERTQKNPAREASGQTQISMDRVTNEIDQNAARKQIEDSRIRFVEGTRSSEAKTQINAIYNAARCYEQEFNYWPQSLDELTEKGYVQIGQSIELRWSFKINDKMIQAVSTSGMEGGSGHVVSFNILEGTWEGYGFSR